MLAKTILILEDEPFIAMDLEMAVSDAGHIALTAIDNEEATRFCEDHVIAGAILDVSLGRKETCKPTATLLSEAEIPFILHTGDLNRVGEHLREIEAPVIAKPRPAEDVVATLLDLLKETA